MWPSRSPWTWWRTGPVSVCWHSTRVDGCGCTVTRPPRGSRWPASHLRTPTNPAGPRSSQVTRTRSRSATYAPTPSPRSRRRAHTP
jgi:hypothetical protein